MNIKNFRIGNYVLDTVDNQQKQIQSNFFRVSDFEDVYFAIRLTDKWKKKLQVKIEKEYAENGTEILYIITPYCEVQCSYIYLEYVHQLQNLYFALSERELILFESTDNENDNYIRYK